MHSDPFGSSDKTSYSNRPHPFLDVDRLPNCSTARQSSSRPVTPVTVGCPRRQPLRRHVAGRTDQDAAGRGLLQLTPQIRDGPAIWPADDSPGPAISAKEPGRRPHASSAARARPKPGSNVTVHEEKLHPFPALRGLEHFGTLLRGALKGQAL